MVASQDDELSALRAKRLQELQGQLQEQAVNQLKAEEQAQQDAMVSEQLNQAIRTILSPDARSRLARIAIVEPQRVQSIKQQLIQLHAAGKLSTPMSDASLKQLLANQSKSRSNASIRRI